MITHRTLGPLTNTDSIIQALRDREIEQRQIVELLNIMTVAAPVGEYRLPLVDEDGTLAQYKLVAGAGMTITIDPVGQTITLTSP